MSDISPINSLSLRRHSYISDGALSAKLAGRCRGHNEHFRIAEFKDFIVGDSDKHDENGNPVRVRTDHSDTLRRQADREIGSVTLMGGIQLRHGCNILRHADSAHANYAATEKTLMDSFPILTPSVFSDAIIAGIADVVGTDNSTQIGGALNEWAEYATEIFKPGSRTTAELELAAADLEGNLPAAEFLGADRQPNIQGGKDAIKTRLDALIAGWQEVSVTPAVRSKAVRLDADGEALTVGETHYADAASVNSGVAHQVPYAFLLSGGILKVETISTAGFLSLESGDGENAAVVVALPDGVTRTVEFASVAGDSAVWADASPVLNDGVRRVFLRLKAEAADEGESGDSSDSGSGS